jgi:hypothetical protein
VVALGASAWTPERAEEQLDALGVTMAAAVRAALRLEAVGGPPSTWADLLARPAQQAREAAERVLVTFRGARLSHPAVAVALGFEAPPDPAYLTPGLASDLVRCTRACLAVSADGVLCMAHLRQGLEARSCAAHDGALGLRAPGPALDVWSVRTPTVGALSAALIHGADLRVGAGGLVRLTPPSPVAGGSISEEEEAVERSVRSSASAPRALAKQPGTVSGQDPKDAALKEARAAFLKESSLLAGPVWESAAGPRTARVVPVQYWDLVRQLAGLPEATPWLDVATATAASRVTIAGGEQLELLKPHFAGGAMARKAAELTTTAMAAASAGELRMIAGVTRACLQRMIAGHAGIWPAAAASQFIMPTPAGVSDICGAPGSWAQATSAEALDRWLEAFSQPVREPAHASAASLFSAGAEEANATQDSHLRELPQGALVAAAALRETQGLTIGEAARSPLVAASYVVTLAVMAAAASRMAAAQF